MRRAATCLALLLVIGLTGAYLVWRYCTPTYSVSGTVTRAGKPLEWKSDNGVLDVFFVPRDRESDRNVYKGQTDARTGAYSITGIPAGNYRVSIRQMDPFPTHDLLGFALSFAESPIFRDVTRDGEVIDIDIAEVLPGKRK
jgi:hypothetical protein